jgi:hypothetical protein
MTSVLPTVFKATASTVSTYTNGAGAGVLLNAGAGATTMLKETGDTAKANVNLFEEVKDTDGSSSDTKKDADDFLINLNSSKDSSGISYKIQ